MAKVATVRPVSVSYFLLIRAIWIPEDVRADAAMLCHPLVIFCASSDTVHEHYDLILFGGDKRGGV